MCLAYVKDLDDSRVANARRGICLILKALRNGLIVSKLLVQNLDDSASCHPGVLGGIHHTHSTFTELLLDLVVADLGSAYHRHWVYQ